ncbi:hypothetical protein D3C72_2417880 [compost metagenome]
MKICSSLSIERESLPFFRYGPKRPFCTVISSPSASAPSTRGRLISFRASSKVTDSTVMDLNSDAVRGLTLVGFFGGFGLPFL